MLLEILFSLVAMLNVNAESKMSLEDEREMDSEILIQLQRVGF